ncbi:MAG: 4Fe-4S ferredoxin [Promethearchaeota archaeon]|nr:MAG: 4Fe-4S ferredoxin [Candidatus Lokiarchaeota archaeon]
MVSEISSKKSYVYWSTPYELSAIANSSKNMITNNLVKTRLIMDILLDGFITSGENVGIKVHVGEAYNTRYLRHDYVHEVVDAIKTKGGIPTLIETQGLGMETHLVEIPDSCTLCLGSRKNAEDHYNIAHLHGYSESIIGAPLQFLDGEKGLDGKDVKINGIHLKKVKVASSLYQYDKLVVISHFKGHPQAGFGGALKQLGIGCVTKQYKFKAHFNGALSITKRCNISKCNQECVAACPVDAIRIENDSAVIDPSICIGCLGCPEACPIRKAIKSADYNDFKVFNEIFIDNALAVVSSFGPQNIRYINFAFDIPAMCDCVVNANMPVIPDLGIFGSKDPVAIDKACVDMETAAPGLPILDANDRWADPIPEGVEKFKALNKNLNPMWQLEAAIKNKLGNEDYELIKI